MSIFQEFFSGFAKSKKTPKAQNLEWMQTLEKKTNTMLLVISSILDKNDRNHQIQQLKRLYTLITDFSPMLQQELQVNGLDSAECEGEMNIVRNTLLELWMKLSMIIEKIENPQDTVQFLNVLFRIMIRNEFDPRYLNFDLNGNIRCTNDVLDYYKRYQYLMHKLYDYITAKLADVIPTSVEGLAPRNTGLFTTYARILVAFYFRMPSVQTDILRATAVPPSIDLWDFTKIRQELADEENKPAPPPPPVPKKKGALVPSVNQVRATSPKPPPRSTTARPSPPPPPIKQSAVVNNTNVTPVAAQVNGTSPTKPPVRAATDADSPTTARSKSTANIMTHSRSQSVSGTSSTSGSPSKTVIPLLNIPRAQLTTVPEGNDESKEIPLTPTTAQRQIDLGNGPIPKLNVNGAAYNSKNNNNNGIRHSIEIERGSYKSTPNIDVESLRISAELPLSPRTAEKLMREKEDKMKEERAEKSRAQMGMLFPGFVQWPLVHRLLFDSDPKMQKIFNTKEPNTGWLGWFRNGESALFVIFIREFVRYVYVKIVKHLHMKVRDPEHPPVTGRRNSLSAHHGSGHVRSKSTGDIDSDKSKNDADNDELMPNASDFDWSVVIGFNALGGAYMYHMRRRRRYPKSVVDCSCALIRCNPSLINYFIKCVYEKTSMFSQQAVIDTLNRIEEWFSAFDKSRLTLPNDFDLDYYIMGLDLILSTDHHQLTAKVLSLTYHYAHLFTGQQRKVIFGDFFIKKHFFSLFLHWDDIVRNYFQQLLIFKTVRVKRSELHKEGFKTPELAKTSMTPPERRVKSYLFDGKSSDLWIDLELYGNITAYIKVIEDQFRDHTVTGYEPRLEVYVPKAMTEYRFYLSRYHQWESQGATQAPGLIPMSALSERRTVIDA